MFADTALSWEPAWPWSIPRVGLPAMLGIALALALLTVWTYSGVRKATWRRVLTVLALRLAALALTFFVVMRPSYGVTRLEGIEAAKLLVIVDASASMTVADMPNGATRWDHVKRLWESRAVRSRLDELAAEQKIEIVQYLGASELRLAEPNAHADGNRTDIGFWLHDLRLKHGHEKNLRGILLISDGADNGTRFSAQEEAGLLRGVCRIQAYGVGDPNDANLRKDIGLTRLDVNPSPAPIKSKLSIKAVAQAPGFANAEVKVEAMIEDVNTKEVKPLAGIARQRITTEKDQLIVLDAVAPELQGEYKITVKIVPHPDEANQQNNEISTYVQVIKKKINVLWVDRNRVYEPVAAICALKAEERFDVHYAVPPPSSTKGAVDPYGPLEYDVIVIGDISAERFAQGQPDLFKQIGARVRKNKMGLLMLGGAETLGNGGWDKHPEWMELLPATFGTPGFVDANVQAEPTQEQQLFLQLLPDAKENARLWNEDFEPLQGWANIKKRDGSTELLRVKGKKDAPLLVSTSVESGLVAVFAADSTARSWRMKQEAVAGYQRFWKQLILYLAQQQDDANQLWVQLDKRRINAGAAEPLGFKFGLRDNKGRDVTDAKFTAKIVGPGKREAKATYVAEDAHQRGTFQGAKELGEYQLVVEVKDMLPTVARFLVVDNDVEMLRPEADHDALRKIAANSDGRFALAEEAALVQFLDELKGQVSGAARHRTTQWPDWKRLPATDHTRDQLAGLWNSFALLGFLLFTALLGCEWLLRRLWGLV